MHVCVGELPCLGAGRSRLIRWERWTENPGDQGRAKEPTAVSGKQDLFKSLSERMFDTNLEY